MDDVQFLSVDIAAGEHKSEEFLRKNPHASVPVLELSDGSYVTESAAIIDYLDHVYGGSAELTGSTAQRRAIIGMQQRHAEARVLNALYNYFMHATPGFGPKHIGEQFPDWGQHQLTVAMQGLIYFNQQLKNVKYVAFEQFSAADITLFCGVQFAQYLELDPFASLNHLAKWYKRVHKRDSIIASSALRSAA